MIRVVWRDRYVQVTRRYTSDKIYVYITYNNNVICVLHIDLSPCKRFGSHGKNVINNVYNNTNTSRP
ncbi:MAG: hypothetical protein QW607_04430 [Desulfurococcaceae archaeon]